MRPLILVLFEGRVYVLAEERGHSTVRLASILGDSHLFIAERSRCRFFAEVPNA